MTAGDRVQLADALDKAGLAAGWLFGTEPSDRALAGWRPRIWIALGSGVMPAKEMRDVLRYAPCHWGTDWREAAYAEADP